MEQKITKIGFRTILGWVIGVLLIIAGIGLLFTNHLQGFFIILAGLVIFPLLWNKIKENWHFELSGFLKVILFIVLLVIGGAFTTNKDANIKETTTTHQDNTTQKTQKLSEQEQEIIHEINEPILSKNMELIINSVKERTTVGSEFFEEKASEGAILVIVDWQYKNTSDKPIGMFSQPEIKLVDSKGVEYSSDIGKSSSYATEADLDRKILSDLNPGITVKDASVFEISEEAYAQTGWFAVLKADRDEYKVKLN